MTDERGTKLANALLIITVAFTLGYGAGWYQCASYMLKNVPAKVKQIMDERHIICTEER